MSYGVDFMLDNTKIGHVGIEGGIMDSIPRKME
jgi:hypothetical protein